MGTEGHSAGHVSVIVSEEGRSLFLAGDTSYTEGLMLEQAVDGVSLRERIAQRTLGRVLRYAETFPTVTCRATTLAPRPDWTPGCL